MANFHFLTGKKDKLGNINARAYKLYRWIGTTENLENIDEQQKDSNWINIDTQDRSQSFNINGAMTSKGKPYEDKFELPFDGSETIKGLPITEETQNGIRYYFRVEGKLTACTSDGFISYDVDFKGKFYVNDESKHSFKTTPTLTINYNGEAGIFIVLTVQPQGGGSYTETVKVRDLDAGHNVTFANITSANMYRALPDYYRTTYIPISSLTDGVGDSNLWCVLGFKEDTAKPNMPLIILFDKNFEVVKTLTYQQIISELKFNEDAFREMGRLNVTHISDIAPGSAEYVVFVSNDASTNGDVSISIGNICFQLFNMPDSYFMDGDTPPETSPYLSVIAIGDGVFYSTSPYSKPEKYERVFRT